MPHPHCPPGETDYIQKHLGQPKEGEPEGVREQINDALKQVFDPEIPINVFEVGLIWDYTVSSEGMVQMEMTLTSPNCPAAESLPADIENGVRRIEGVNDLKLDILWDPTYDIAMMSEAAKLTLGF